MNTEEFARLSSLFLAKSQVCGIEKQIIRQSQLAITLFSGCHKFWIYLIVYLKFKLFYMLYCGNILTYANARDINVCEISSNLNYNLKLCKNLRFVCIMFFTVCLPLFILKFDIGSANKA